jgi:hypothetical protein
LQNEELEKELEGVRKINSEKEMRINLLKITIENLQTELASLKELHEKVVSESGEKIRALAVSMSENEFRVSTMRDLLAIKEAELVEAKLTNLPVQNHSEIVDYEAKFTDLKNKNKELLALYNAAILKKAL